MTLSQLRGDSRAELGDATKLILVHLMSCTGAFYGKDFGHNPLGKFSCSGLLCVSGACGELPTDPLYYCIFRSYEVIVEISKDLVVHLHI